MVYCQAGKHFFSEDQDTCGKVGEMIFGIGNRGFCRGGMIPSIGIHVVGENQPAPVEPVLMVSDSQRS